MALKLANSSLARKTLAALLALIPVAAGAILAPRYLASIFLTGNVEREASYSSPVDLEQGGGCGEPVFSNPVLSLQFPAIMPTDDTRNIKVELSHWEDCSIPTAQSRTPSYAYSARLTSPAFDITPSMDMIPKSGEGQVDWGWLIKPKAPGNLQLILEFDRPVLGDRELERIRKLLFVESATESSLLLRLEVTNALGLTSRQEAFLKAFGALIGLVGTVLGYPIWKRLSQERPAQAVERTDIANKSGSAAHR